MIGAHPKRREVFICIMMLLFVLQSGLEQVASVFTYIDELPVLLAILCIIKKPNRIKRTKQDDLCIFLALAVFVVVGLTGNILYRYQPVNLVLTDVLSNLKFFFAIYAAEQGLPDNVLNYKNVPRLANYLSIALFVLFLVDRVFNIFGGQIRYGLKTNQLFYTHPTYLAGTCVFLIGILTIFNYKKYKWPIVFNLILLAFTLRGKAIAGAACYLLICFIVLKMHSKLKIWQIGLVGLLGVAIAWNQIYFYFIKLSGASARSVMFATSLRIMRDYFPIGTGFGTYGSHSAAVNYSPVYIKYGFESIYELRNSSVGTFFDDQFWPIIFGQTGAIGTACYLFILYRLFNKIQSVRKVHSGAYIAALFTFVYLLISSVAEPAFNNSIAIPIACIIGVCFRLANNMNHNHNHRLL